MRFSFLTTILLVQSFRRYYTLLQTPCLREDGTEGPHLKYRTGEENDRFQDQYEHHLRLFLVPYYGTEQYRCITSRTFTRQYSGVTERFFPVNGQSCLLYLSNTAVKGTVTNGVLVDLSINFPVNIK